MYSILYVCVNGTHPYACTITYIIGRELDYYCCRLSGQSVLKIV